MCSYTCTCIIIQKKNICVHVCFHGNIQDTVSGQYDPGQYHTRTWCYRTIFQDNGTHDNDIVMAVSWGFHVLDPRKCDSSHLKSLNYSPSHVMSIDIIYSHEFSDKVNNYPQLSIPRMLLWCRECMCELWS